MMKLTNTASTALTANQIIPLNLDFNTNNNLVYTNNGVKIRKAGFYDTNAMFDITATGTGTVSIQLYANGVAIPEAIAQHTFNAAGDVHTLNITDLERLVQTYNFSYEVFNFVVSANCTMTNANVSVKEIR